MIAIPVTAQTNKEAIEQLKETEKKADIVEIRLDYIENPNIKEIIKNSKKPLIFTNRLFSKGGKKKQLEKERIDKLKEAIRLKADYIDIEYATDESIIKELIKNKKSTKIIVSYHNFKETPKNLAEIYKKIKSLKPAIIKITTFADNCNDNLKVFELLTLANKEKISLIAFCMGKKGKISRILATEFGSYLTFCSLKKGKESAPGQISIDEYKKIKEVLEC